jgi:hypothetical protein
VQRGGILNDPPTIRIIRAKGDGMGGHDDWELAGTHSITQAFTTGEDYKLGSANVVGFSWFGAGGNNEFPLPVELIQFSGTCENYNIILSWSTASESNSDYFAVERSVDGLNWRIVAKVTAAGNSQSLLNYGVLLSKTSYVGDNYFRLQQFDIDGSNQKYMPILLDCEDKKEMLSVSPNPSNGNFVIALHSTEAHLSKIEVIDFLGKTKFLKTVEIIKGFNQFFINEEISAGMYVIKITANDEMLHQIKHVVK